MERLSPSKQGSTTRFYFLLETELGKQLSSISLSLGWVRRNCYCLSACPPACFSIFFHTPLLVDMSNCHDYFNRNTPMFDLGSQFRVRNPISILSYSWVSSISTT